MVRALPFRTPTRLDFGRVIALAAAIALHMLALLLLLIPMAAPRLARVVKEKDPWVIPATPVKPPEPPQPIEPLRPATIQPPTTQPTVIPPTPIPVTQQVIDTGTLPASEGAEQQLPSNSIGPVDTSPMVGSQLQYVSAPPPPYPAAELRRNIEGTVMLRILVDVDGKPLEVVVDASSGNRNLDRAASQHVLKHWRFKPAVRDGVTVQAYGLVPISFALR